MRSIAQHGEISRYFARSQGAARLQRGGLLIRSELGANASMRKVRPHEAVGNYGDYVFQTSDADAVFMKLKHAKVVRII